MYSFIFAFFVSGISAFAEPTASNYLAAKMAGTYEVMQICGDNHIKPEKVVIQSGADSNTGDFSYLRFDIQFSNSKTISQYMENRGSEKAWQNLAKRASQVLEMTHKQNSYGYTYRTVRRNMIDLCYSGQCDERITDDFYQDVAVQWARVYTDPDNPNPSKLIIDGAERRGHFSLGKAKWDGLPLTDYGYYCYHLKRVE